MPSACSGSGAPGRPGRAPETPAPPGGGMNELAAGPRAKKACGRGWRARPDGARGRMARGAGWRAEPDGARSRMAGEAGWPARPDGGRGRTARENVPVHAGPAVPEAAPRPRHACFSARRELCRPGAAGPGQGESATERRAQCPGRAAAAILRGTPGLAAAAMDGLSLPPPSYVALRLYRTTIFFAGPVP
jgi:hypothetical protein